MRKKLLIAGVLSLLVFQSCSSNEDLSTGQSSNVKATQKNLLRTGRSDSGSL